MNTSTAPRLAPHDAERAHRIDHRHGLRWLSFGVLWMLATAGSTWCVAQGGWARIGVGPFVLLSAACLHGISLFTHEGVHGVLSRRWWLNDLLAAVSAWPVLQNFSGYRVLHLRHHANLGAEGDPDHYANYTQWTWGIFLMNWGRLILGYPAYITLIPILGWRQGTTKDRVGIALELVGAATLLMLMATLLPWPWFLWGWVAPMICINTMVNIRGMSQHTLLPDAEHAVRGSRTIETNALVRYFMCNENFHLEHHLYPGVPWYNLPFVHERLRPQLQEQGATFIPSYFSFVRTFVRESLRRGPFREMV